MPRINKPDALFIHSFTAEAAITANRVVALGDADGNCDVMESGDCPLGVALNDAAIGEQVQVCLFGVCQVAAGGAVTAANIRDGRFAVAAATTGKVTAATLGAAASAFTLGRFLSPAAADGDLVSVFVNPQQIQTT